MDRVGEARLAVLRWLADAAYSFTTPAPSTHRRVLWRRGPLAQAHDLADVFGWNLPFADDLLAPALLTLMEAGEMIAPQGRRRRATLAVASAGGGLYLHTAFKAKGEDAVFFGPDSYRFIAFLRSAMPALKPGAAIVDIGAGSGVGGLFAAGLAPGCSLLLADVNETALDLAAVNAAFAGISTTRTLTEGLIGIEGPLDLVVANPPYVAGQGEPTYAGGGDLRGAGLSLDWAKQAMTRLDPGGRLLLYTGSAIERGRDGFRAALTRACAGAGCELAYEELDPDVFPGLLLKPAYWGVERIAAVGAVVTR